MSSQECTDMKKFDNFKKVDNLNFNTSATEKLKNLVRLVANSMGGSDIIITEDYGFLYTLKLPEQHWELIFDV